jgi:MOSC domain-containing protein YiiM
VPQLVETVNVGRAAINPSKPKVGVTGIGKQPTDAPVEVRAPGPKQVGGRGSGLVGDFIGDRRHHGGDLQAVYAYQREDLDRWAAVLGRDLPNGSFGENLTTSGIDLAEVLVGERWLVGTGEDEASSVVLEVSVPRIPCATFASRLGERGWVKRFTADGRSGTYLRVVRAGTVRSGDPITVVFTPDHDVTVGTVFRATTLRRDLLPQLLAARDYLEPETIALAEQGRTFTLDDA